MNPAALPVLESVDTSGFSKRRLVQGSGVPEEWDLVNIGAISECLGLADGISVARAAIAPGSRVEEPFGWGTVGGLARPMLRGVKKLDFKFTLTMAAYDLIKLPRLIGAAA
jgi:hypothetical protein